MLNALRNAFKFVGSSVKLHVRRHKYVIAIFVFISLVYCVRGFYIGHIRGLIQKLTYFVYSMAPPPTLWHRIYSANVRPTGETTIGGSNTSAYVGIIWPRTTNETNDRVVEQIDFIKDFASVNHRYRPSKTKIILRVGDFNFYNYKEGQGHFTDDGCPKNWCTITTNASFRSWADALLISEFGWSSRKKYLPKPSHQIWIVRHHESPKMNRINPNTMKDLVNWTSSYRRDSTIVTGFYGHYERTANATPEVGVNYAASKKKKVAWLVSNCHPYNNRWGYVQELAKYIDVNIYGACGKGQKKIEELSVEYKFYLAFENAHCKDYITEKLLVNALGYRLIPVVLGASREDYAAAAPPRSYIHVDDYESPRHLADYLHSLDRNDSLYNDYFAWKGMYNRIDERYWCRLCMMLHLQEYTGYVQWYKDYGKWWNGACWSAGVPSSARADYFPATLGIIICIAHFIVRFFLLRDYFVKHTTDVFVERNY